MPMSIKLSIADIELEPCIGDFVNKEVYKELSNSDMRERERERQVYLQIDELDSNTYNINII